MPRAVAPKEDAPCPYCEDDFRRMEEALRQLHQVSLLIDRCERCNIPVAEARADMEAQRKWYQDTLAEFRGPQSPIGGRHV